MRTLLPQSTTVKVSKETVKRLASLRRSLHARSMDETIEILVKRRRKEALDAVFGTDRAKSRKFTEDDRLEDRS
jgi:predicted CopG family antitoxin